MTTVAGTPSPEKLEEFQTLTRRYARFCSEISGLPLIFCAIVSVAIFLLGQQFPMTKTTYLLFATGIFLVWISYAQMFRNAYYRKLGFVQTDPKQEKKLTQADWIKILISTAISVSIIFLIPALLGQYTNKAEWNLISGAFGILNIILAFLFPRLIKEPGLELPILVFGLAIHFHYFSIDFFSDATKMYLLITLSFGMAFLGLRQHLRFLEVTRQLTEIHSKIGTPS
jgi:hypothetical protein